jgi:hypothetical protein
MQCGVTQPPPPPPSANQAGETAEGEMQFPLAEIVLTLLGLL